MRKANGPGKLHRISTGRHCCPWILFVAISAGCNSTQHTAGDPLHGPVSIPAANGQQLPPPAPAKAQADAPLTPTTQNNNTPAGLANNTELPRGRPLTIGENQGGVNWQLTNTVKNPAPGQKPSVLPVPRDAPAAPGGLQPSSWSAEQAPATANLLAPLKARGAVGEQQEKVAEGIRFSCFIPNPNNPANLRQYEVTAPDLASAVQAILRQIDSN